MLTTSLSPAMARGGNGWSGWNGGGYGDGYGRRHHRRGDNDTGEVLAGVLIGAILVGIASSASKKAKEARRYPTDERRTSSADVREGAIRTENAAVDACAAEAERQGGEMASVRTIDKVRSAPEGWDVEGQLEQRNSWRDRTPMQRAFTCSVRLGEIDSLYIDGDKVAAR